MAKPTVDPSSSPAPSSQYAEAHAARMRVIAGKFSLSEIARRTGFPLSCVHGYVNKTRIPAEMFSRLVDQFGVNPAWLLTGEGAPLLADISPVTAQFSTELLTLVEAMEAVTKMKLGALSGDQKSVRALNEALSRHDALRARLDTYSRAVLKKLDEQMAAANAALNFDALKTLLASARRISPLCQDIRLLAGINYYSARLHQMNGETLAALELYRAAFQKAVAAQDVFGDELLEFAHAYAGVLATLGRANEGILVCESALLFFDTTQLNERTARVLLLRGWFDVWTGNLEAALRAMNRAVPHMDMTDGGPAGRYLAARIFAGLTTVEQAFAGLGEESVGEREILMSFAAYRARLDELRTMRKSMVSTQSRYWTDSSRKLGANHPIVVYADFVRKALQDRDPGVCDEFDNAVELDSAPQPDRKTALTIRSCQIALAAGNHAHARRRLAQSEELLAQLPKGTVIYPLTLATHWQNVRQLHSRRKSKDSEAALAHANDFFKQWIARGYYFFRDDTQARA
ncbi:MAG: helix-turn-helix transcriptional regulator [Planctomycetes bacterium]|nr:helix-turn-helix transcriptional regulator [Planctomycetota bacterium]